MPRSTNLSVATMGIDIGKNSFHVVGLDQRGAIVGRQRWTRSQIRARLANMSPCLIGMEACVGAHHCWASRTPASLDRPCARRRCPSAGRDEGTASGANKGTFKEKESY